jgi:hypothetical protein
MQQVITTKNLTTLQQNTYELPKTERSSLITRFINWCDIQEENRFLWLGIALMGNIGMVLPVTLVTLLITSGFNFPLWTAACIANVPVLAVNLAAQPTKITLPFLFFAWVVNFGIILYSLAYLLF